MFLLAVASVSSLVSPMQEVVEQTKNRFPTTEEAIVETAENTIREFESSLALILETPKSEQTYQTVLEKIQKIGRKCLVATSILHEAEAFHTEKNLIEKAKERCFSIVTRMTTGLAFNEKLKGMVANLLKQADQLSGKERNHLHQVLLSMGKDVDIEPSTPFEKRIGTAAPESVKSEMKILTFNVCGLFEETPIIFGGLVPWRERFNKIVETIDQSDSDVVCLQEVFDDDLEEALYQKLKSKYANFYTIISPRYLGFKPSTYGVRSGLMVFSKHSVTNGRFDCIPSESPYVNRGVFSFDVGGKMKVATTHLAAFQGPAQKKKRLEQMNAVTKILYDMKPSIPVVLCGDLNISWCSGEPAEEVLCKDYDINLKVAQVTPENCTYCDFTNYHWKDTFNPKYTILDYVLHLKNTPSIDIKTRRVNTWGEKPPYDAASDHMGLLANVSFSH
jgi:endonuclease/exonuclease/phosphatase family metal-dependent hydrolase